MVQGAAFRILACFYDVEVGGFAELCAKAGYPTDLGGYYIRQLIAGGYLEKIDRGQYQVLPKGKQEIARRYGRKLTELQPRLAVLLVARQNESYVVMRRKKQPFIDTAEWPAGMVGGGETVDEAAQRIAKIRLGVAVQPSLKGLFRRIDRYDGSLFDDKIFAVFTCDIAAGTSVKDVSDTGENKLYTAATLQTVEKPSRALLDIWRFSEGGEPYAEYGYDLAVADLGIISTEL